MLDFCGSQSRAQNSSANGSLVSTIVADSTTLQYEMVNITEVLEEGFAFSKPL